jgi:hypothetical protein
MGGPPKQPYVLVDDTLSEMDQCKRYSLSQLPLQRYIYVKRLSACARRVGVQDAIAHLVPLFKKLVTDKEEIVRQALGEEVGKFAIFLGRPDARVVPDVYYDENGNELPPLSDYSGETNSTKSDISANGESADSEIDSDSPGYAHIKNSIIPVVQKLLLDSSVEVRQATAKSLIQVASVLTGDDVGQLVLTLVLCLAHDEVITLYYFCRPLTSSYCLVERRATNHRCSSDERPSSAIRYGAYQLTTSFMNFCPGSVLVMNYVALELAAFSDDSTFRVRKTTAQSFGS